MKVNINYENLVNLAKIARTNGTQDSFIDVALQWAESAEEWIQNASVKINKLEKELELEKKGYKKTMEENQYENNKR